jgi:pilus assembly protein CpaF
VHESVSVQGPVVELSIPAVAEPRWSLEMLLQARALTPAIANLLTACVYGGLNIVICAGPGAQAFGLVAALADAAPPECRQLVVRPRYEPGLLPDGAVVLEGRRCAGSPGSTVMQTLVRTALTLSPDRLLVHEMTGAEAVDVFAAMGRGLQGTVVSTRAGSAAEGLSRLATLVGLAGDSANHVTRTIHVAQSVELLITLARFPDGHTRVTQVAEACLSPSGAPRAIDLVTIDPYTRNWTHTGVTPTFFAELQRRGIAVDMGG